MKAYCMNCGHPNEHSGKIPNKCESCGTSFEVARVEFRIPIPSKSSVSSMKELIQDQLEGSEFDSFMEGAPEPFSEQEINAIFLKDADRGINLKDLIAEGMAQQAKATKTKAKKRVPKRK